MENESGAAVLPAAAFYSRRQEQHAQKRGGRFAVWMVGVSFTGDVLAIVGGLLTAFWLRFHTPMRGLGRSASQMDLADYRGHLIFLTVTLLIILFYSDFYGTGRPQRLRRLNAVAITSCTLWFAANFALSFELNTLPIVSRIFLCNAFVCTVGTLLAWRWLFDHVLGIAPVAALLQRRILFVGWSEQAAKMLAHIGHDPKPYYRIAGCVPSVSGGFDLEPPAAVQQLGNYEDLADILSDRMIDLAIVADQNPTRGELHGLVTV